jgi:hypothetical protein
MKRTILFVLLLAWQIMVYAAISIDVTPSSVQLGEMFRLVLTIDNPKETGVPDLTPLKENFNIVGTERSMSYSMVNGQMHSISQWVILLTAKKTGLVSIPSIRVGLQQSAVKNIDVHNGQGVSSSDDPDEIPQEEILLKTELSKNDVFVNQQVIYTVKLMNRQRLVNAEYSPPSVEDALLIPLGDARTYQTSIDGQPYAVEEQRYAIFPQKSGQLTIKPPSFSALLFDAVPRQVNVDGKPVTISVKPIPANQQGKHWLPAKQVSITETFEQLNTTLDQGSTLVRTVTLQASGLPAQLLPTLNFAEPSQFNAYPEKPELKNTAGLKELIGRVEVKVTYLFNKSGRITIPEMHVPWFNVETQKEEVVSLPAHLIEVKPTVTSTPGNTYDTTMEKTGNEKPAVAYNSHAWIEGAAIGFGFAWLAMLVIWLLKKWPVTKKDKKIDVLKQLKKACAENNPNKTQDALLQWAASQWRDIEMLNLYQLSKVVQDTAFKKQLHVLSQVLYSQDNGKQWQGQALWRCLSAYKKTKPVVNSKKNKGLPPINP